MECEGAVKEHLKLLKGNDLALVWLVILLCSLSEDMWYNAAGQHGFEMRQSSERKVARFCSGRVPCVIASELCVILDRGMNCTVAGSEQSRLVGQHVDLSLYKVHVSRVQSGCCQNGVNLPVLKHGPRSLTYVRVLGWQTRSAK